jgi:hypothetical protein
MDLRAIVADHDKGWFLILRLSIALQPFSPKTAVSGRKFRLNEFAGRMWKH